MKMSAPHPGLQVTAQFSMKGRCIARFVSRVTVRQFTPPGVCHTALLFTGMWRDVWHAACGYEDALRKGVSRSLELSACLPL